ncbi:hypothetical protein GX586_06940 [bacterium]|nr:hypothetical protein [bacterium]
MKIDDLLELLGFAFVIAVSVLPAAVAAIRKRMDASRREAEEARRNAMPRRPQPAPVTHDLPVRRIEDVVRDEAQEELMTTTDFEPRRIEDLLSELLGGEPPPRPATPPDRAARAAAQKLARAAEPAALQPQGRRGVRTPQRAQPQPQPAGEQEAVPRLAVTASASYAMPREEPQLPGVGALTPDRLRQAVILNEVLGPPVSLR